MRISKLAVLAVMAVLISGYTLASASPGELSTITILPPPIKLPTPIPIPTITVTKTDITVTITKPPITITIIPIPTVTIHPTTAILKKPQKLHKVTIEVEPPWAGEVKPIGVGKHSVKEGERIILRAIPNAGYQFDHWTVDGHREISSKVLRLRVHKDHVIVAHFTQIASTSESRTPAKIPTGSPPLEVERAVVGCTLPDDFPRSLTYSGMYADLLYNEDLLTGFGEGTVGKVVVGREAVQPQPWRKYGVKMGDLNLWINGTRFSASFGSEDYGIIYLKCRNGYLTIKVAGITRYGTRAALLYLLSNPEEVNGKTLVVVRWMDTNSNGKVELGEVSPVISIP